MTCPDATPKYSKEIKLSNKPLSKLANAEQNMEQKQNPFKVPEDYFASLNEKLNAKAADSHVSSPRLFKYMASLATVVVLGLSAWLVFIQNTDLDLRQNKAFAFLFNGFGENDKKAEQADPHKATWQAYKQELKKEAEQIVFTEDELLYMEFFAQEDEDELWLSNTEVE